MAEGRRSGGSGGGQGRSSGGRGAGGSGRVGGSGRAGGKPAGKPTGKATGKSTGKPAGRSGGRAGGPGSAGKAGKPKGSSGRSSSPRSGAAKSSGPGSRSGSSAGGARSGTSSSRSSSASGRPSSGRPSSGRPSSGRPGAAKSGGRPSAGRPPSGRGGGRSTDRRETTRSDARQGGFGPHSVDQRDEETRARRNQPRDDSRGRGRRGDAPSEETEERAPRRPALRVVGTRRPSGAKPASTRKATTKRGAAKQTGTTGTKRRRRRGPAGVQDEMAQLAGRDASRALGTLMAAADAYSNDREREAIRILRPLRDRMPDSQSVRELMGLSQYRVGNYNAAAKELEAYYELSGEVDQHPVLMDCYRAQHRWKKVADLWEELAAVSPSADVVTEGRIVYAGALADQDRLPDALALLRKRGEMVKQPKDHHLRLWYALADLEERAGNLARARELFHLVARVEPGFADVAERLAALG